MFVNDFLNMLYWRSGLVIFVATPAKLFLDLDVRNDNHYLTRLATSKMLERKERIFEKGLDCGFT